MGKKMFDINNNGGFNDKKRFMFIGCLLSIIPLSIILPIVIIKAKESKATTGFRSGYEISRLTTEVNKELISDYVNTVNSAIADGIITPMEKATINKKMDAIKSLKTIYERKEK